MTKKYFLTAEIGCNHQGDIDIAKRLILQAKNTGCDIVKFQKRDPKLQFSKEVYESAHPTPENAFGATYGEHRENLEFSTAQHKELMNFALQNKIDYSCSVFDTVSAKDIAAINPAHIKIPSPVNNNLEIAEYIAKIFEGTIHISLGMTTRKEENELITILEKYGKLHNTVLYHCISAYPTEDSDVTLREIERIRATYGKRIKAVGFSGHHKGYLADCTALALGSEYFERHFTFDKTAKGSDHRLSLNEEEMSELKQNLEKTSTFLSYKEKEILDCELKTRKFHKYKSVEKEVESGF